MSTAVAVRTVELLRFTPEIQRADVLFSAMTRCQSPDLTIRETRSYCGGSDLLVLWGPGHPARFEPIRQQVADGGHALCFDLAYWQRDSKVRVSIDAAHPQRWVMAREWSPRRFKADGVPVANAWNPSGPAVVAGIGEKARVQYGAATVDAWEARMVAECRQLGLAVQYRPKRGAVVPIDQALRGASVLVTWHSNVAVDAIRMGIPAICRDGAAAAVCPSELGKLEPLPESVRDRFLANLAWYQWAPSEMTEMWAWLAELLS